MAAKSKPPPPPPRGTSNYLSDRPSRGLFTSNDLASNLSGARVYVCDHDTSAPEEQVINTMTANVLIRTLQKQKSDQKVAPKASKERSKGKRSAGTTLEESTPAKRANGSSSAAKAPKEGSTTGFSETTLQAMTVERLRSLLKGRGLSTKGKKDELVSRFRDAP